MSDEEDNLKIAVLCPGRGRDVHNGWSVCCGLASSPLIRRLDNSFNNGGAKLHIIAGEPLISLKIGIEKRAAIMIDVHKAMLIMPSGAITFQVIMMAL